MRKLSDNQNRALIGLLTTRTHKEAAAKAGISVRMLNNYLNDDKFNKAYSKATRRLVDDATRNMHKALDPSLNALIDMVGDKNEPGSTRVAAARTILEYTLKYTEFNDILKAIDEEIVEVDADVL